MKSITIRNVPKETHRLLRIRAARNGRSLEAELRALLGAIAQANAPKNAASAPSSPRPEPRDRSAPASLDLTHRDLAIDAAQARRKVRRILEREAE